jgi:hypothetical protein
LGIDVKARNGDSVSLSYLYWGWIRHIAKEEGVALPQSGSSVDSLDGDVAKKLASAMRTRAEKIRKGLAPRDAASFVQKMDKEWFPSRDEKDDAGAMKADFDDPNSMDETADFFDSSGGVTLRY